MGSYQEDDMGSGFWEKLEWFLTRSLHPFQLSHDDLWAMFPFTMPKTKPTIRIERGKINNTIRLGTQITSHKMNTTKLRLSEKGNNKFARERGQ